MNRRVFWLLIALLGLGIIVALVFVLQPYFAGEKTPNTVLFSIGNIAIHWYGLLIALSFIPGLYVAYKMAQNWSINPDHVFNLAIICAPLALIFARLFYCALNWSYFSRYPLQILYLWQGGLSIYGVIFGGILGALIYALASRVSFLRLLDLGAVPLILGQAIGRWGNFFNQELFGYPTDLPWKLYIAPEFRPREYMGYNFFHPTFLYESIYNFILFAVLLWFSRRKNLRPGIIVSLYLLFYGVFRFFLEFVRIEPASVWFMSWGQVASLISVIVGGLMLFFIQRSKQNLLTTPLGPDSTQGKEESQEEVTSRPEESPKESSANNLSHNDELPPASST